MIPGWDMMHVNPWGSGNDTRTSVQSIRISDGMRWNPEHPLSPGRSLETPRLSVQLVIFPWTIHKILSNTSSCLSLTALLWDWVCHSYFTVRKLKLWRADMWLVGAWGGIQPHSAPWTSGLSLHPNTTAACVAWNQPGRAAQRHKPAALSGAWWGMSHRNWKLALRPRLTMALRNCCHSSWMTHFSNIKGLLPAVQTVTLARPWSYCHALRLSLPEQWEGERGRTLDGEWGWRQGQVILRPLLVWPPGTQDSPPRPSKVFSGSYPHCRPGLSSAVSFLSSDTHRCFLLQDREVRCPLYLFFPSHTFLCQCLHLHLRKSFLGHRNGLNSDPTKNYMIMSQHLETVKLIIFGKKTFADVIKFRILRWDSLV